MLAKHEPVFENGEGTMKQFKAKLHLKPHSLPKFIKARSVLFAVLPKVEAELGQLEKDGMLEKVTYSEWGSPIVVVPKKGRKIRICGDYKTTVNPCLDVNQYPIPKASDLFSTLSGRKIFPKLDLTQAYHQMEAEDVSHSQGVLTITTHKACTINAIYLSGQHQLQQSSNAPWNRYSRGSQAWWSSWMTSS